MEKRFFITAKAIALFFILMVSVNCKRKESTTNKSESNHLDSVYHLIRDIDVIGDSIKSIKKPGLTKLLVCIYSESESYRKVYLYAPNLPYSIKNNYLLKNINGMDVLIVDIKDTNFNKTQNLEIKNLVKQNIIDFDQTGVFENPPFYKFIICKNDSKKISCFDNIMQGKETINSIKDNRVYNESVFYPKCD